MVFKAAIFDMDGLLIDSESFWRIAEKKVFGGLGIQITEAMCKKIMGRRIDEVIASWYGRDQRNGKTPQEVELDIVAIVTEMVEDEGIALKGVSEILETLSGFGLKLALASSSPPSLIQTVVDKLEIGCYFEILCSAVNEEFGKPHPGVFLTTANQLKVTPGECLVFEDSVVGIQAAKAAGMVSIAVPAPDQFHEHRFDEADFKFHSLSEFTLDVLEAGGLFVKSSSMKISTV